jgi:hypothetical protein
MTLSSINVPADEPVPPDPEAPEEDVAGLPEVGAPEAWSGALRPHPATATLNNAVRRTIFEAQVIILMRQPLYFEVPLDPEVPPDEPEVPDEPEEPMEPDPPDELELLPGDVLLPEL